MHCGNAVCTVHVYVSLGVGVVYKSFADCGCLQSTFLPTTPSLSFLPPSPSLSPFRTSKSYLQTHFWPTLHHLVETVSNSPPYPSIRTSTSKAIYKLIFWHSYAASPCTVYMLTVANPYSHELHEI